MIVMTMPAGDIGDQVVDDLIDRGEASCLVVRDPAKLPAKKRVAAVAG